MKFLIILLLLVGCSTHQDLHNSLEETLLIIDKSYPEKPDQEKLRQGMINGLIQSIDPHGSYLAEYQLKNLIEVVEGGDLKLGIILTKHEKGFLAQKVFEKSPANLADIKEGDILLEFDGTRLKNLSLENILDLIKEKKPYKIILLRNKKRLEKEITPGPFSPPSVELKWFKNVAYFKISCIRKSSADEVKSHLETIKKSANLAGLILDLRDCPGGSFDAGIGIASQFLDGHPVVEMQQKEGLAKFASSGTDILNKLPIVILQNKQTFSAAEIISAALKAHKRATLIGENTAGGATAKSIINYPNKKDGLIITIAFLNDPNGKRIGKEGVEPDILKKEIKESKKSKSDPYITEALRFLQSKLRKGL